MSEHKLPCVTNAISAHVPKVRLGDVCEIVSYRGHQIKQSEIRPNGKYPVVSQSEELIEGYSNSEIAIEDLPLVIFGDHTCCVKLIDFPFVVGADGTKLLKSKEAEAPYLSFALRFLQPTIADGKYRRHFGDLMEREIPLPPIAAQRQIAAKLNTICEIVAKRKAQLAQLQQLVKSRFVEMFGGCLANTPLIEFGKVFTGSTPSMKEEAYYHQADFCFVKPSDLSYDVRKFSDSECHLSYKAETVARMFNPGAVLVTCIGATIGKMGIAQVRGSCNQQINFIEPFDNVDSSYLAYAIQSRHNELVSIANSTAVPIINKSEFCKFKIPLPPLALQREFAAFVAKVDKLAFAVKRSLETVEKLYRQHLSEAFS